MPFVIEQSVTNDVPAVTSDSSAGVIFALLIVVYVFRAVIFSFLKFSVMALFAFGLFKFIT